MSIARPDTSRRREPCCPGRRFGPCTETRRFNENSKQRAFIALAVGAFALPFLIASPAAAEGDEGPIVLNNEDVARLHGPQSAADTPGNDTTRHAQATGEAPDDRTREDLAESMAREAELRARLDRISQRSMGSVEKALDARLFADQAGPLSARGDSQIHMKTAPAAPMPGGLDANPPDDGGARKAAYSDEPACIFGAQGRLLFEPEGRTCRSVRKSEQQAAPSRTTRPSATPKDDNVGCVYGSRGQLLYGSDGVECPAKRER